MREIVKNILIVSVSNLVAMTALAQDGFRYKFNKGETLRYEVEVLKVEREIKDNKETMTRKTETVSHVLVSTKNVFPDAEVAKRKLRFDPKSILLHTDGVLDRSASPAELKSIRESTMLLFFQNVEGNVFVRQTGDAVFLYPLVAPVPPRSRRRRGDEWHYRKPIDGHDRHLLNDGEIVEWTCRLIRLTAEDGAPLANIEMRGENSIAIRNGKRKKPGFDDVQFDIKALAQENKWIKTDIREYQYDTEQGLVVNSKVSIMMARLQNDDSIRHETLQFHVRLLEDDDKEQSVGKDTRKE